MSSITLPPYDKSGFQRFMDTQFRTKPIPPPAGTSFQGQTAIITGSNVGIGLEAARVFLSLDLTHLILAVRSLDKGEAAAQPLRKAYPNATVEVWPLDMLSYDSIREFANRCKTLERLDIAILNAAASTKDFKINPATGHEEVFQVNYLSTALLSLLLLPILRDQKSPIITTTTRNPRHLSIVSSGLALDAKFPNHLSNPLIPSFDSKATWASAGGQAERYSVTKTLTLMLALQLSQLVSATDVVVNAVDPGFTGGTALHRDMPPVVQGVLWLLKKATARTTTEAAWTYVDAVIDKDKDSEREERGRGRDLHGSFLMNWQVTPFPALLYTKEGQQTSERLWTETIEDLAQRGFRELLAF